MGRSGEQVAINPEKRGDTGGGRQTPQAYAKRSRRFMFGLGLLLGVVIILLRHGPDWSAPVSLADRGLGGDAAPEFASVPPERARGETPATASVRGAELVRQGYFEAQVRVRYSATEAQAAQRGYLYLYERDNARSTGVGAFVKAGQHSATVLLNRRLARKAAYPSGQLVALMYRYGTREPPYFEQDLALQLQWPGLRDVGVKRRVERYPDVRQLQLFRNIPRYEAFALDLVERGFPAGQMTILYAPCRKCRAGFHFGPQVRVEVLQEILRALRAHDAPVHWIEYDDRPARTGIIQIGWTPGKKARPLWKHLDALLQEERTLAEFKRIVGL